MTLGKLGQDEANVMTGGYGGRGEHVHRSLALCASFRADLGALAR